MTVPIDSDRFFTTLASLLMRIQPQVSKATAVDIDSALAALARYVLDADAAITPTQHSAAPSTSEAEGASTSLHSNVQELIAILRLDRKEREEREEHGAKRLRTWKSYRPKHFPPPDVEQITRCLREQYPDRPNIHAENVVEMLGGNGKQTTLFDVVDDHERVQMVMRRDIPGSFNRTTVIDEFPLLCGLHRQGFPVPRPLWLDGSTKVLPTPYIVTARVQGELAGDGRGPRRDSAFDASRMMARMMASLHALDPGSIEGWFDRRWDAEAALANLAYWEDYYRSYAGTVVPAVEVAFQWLRANVELGLQPGVIVHGEAGFHNLLVDGDELAAVLDWELAHVGSPVEDLCYVKGQIEQQGTFRDFIDLYVDAGGQRPSPAAIEYFDIYRLTRNIALFSAAVHSFNSGDTDRFPLLYGSALLCSSYIRHLSAAMERILADGRLSSPSRS
jgi:aminoglycoside phosphotransferase (APT) family kinase protein